MHRLFSKIVLFVLALAPLPACAEPDYVRLLAGAVSEPIGHYNYRTAHPAQVEADLALVRRVSGTTITTRREWEIVRATNEVVNVTIEPVSDTDHWGQDRPEVWSVPDDGMGDCEDYVLLKKELLIAAGLPPRALLITVVRRANGEGHAVLMVRTQDGDYVLDNLTDEVKIWSETGYVFVKQQSSADPAVWVGIHNVHLHLQVSATPGAN